MSLHVYLNPEARKRYETQQRSSRIASIFVSILIVSLVALLLALLALKLPAKTQHWPTYVPGSWLDDTDPDPKSTTLVHRPTPAPPGGARANVLITSFPYDLSIPLPELNPSSVEPFGLDEGIGEGGSGSNSIG